MNYYVVNAVGTTIAMFELRADAEAFMHAVSGWDKGWDIEVVR